MISQDFAQASVFGRDDEFAEMLAIKDRGDGGPPRSMTLSEAEEHHIKVWKFPSQAAQSHEFSHVLLGLAQRIALGRVIPIEYQGTYPAETFAVAVEDLLTQLHLPKQSAETTKERFINNIGFHYSTFEIEENKIRTALWRLSAIRKAAGKTSGLLINELKAEGNHEDQDQLTMARAEGILVYDSAFCPDDQKEFYQPFHFGGWIVGSDDPEKPYCYLINGMQDRLPSGSNGTEDFVAYEMPTDSEIEILSTPIIAAKELMQTRYHEIWAENPELSELEVYPRVYATMHVSELDAVMQRACIAKAALVHRIT